MQFGIYILGAKAIVPTVCETMAGFHLETEPVISLALDDPELPAALSKVILRGNPRIPTPPGGSGFPKPAVLAYTSAKTWKGFSQMVEYWRISEEDGSYFLSHSTKDIHGNFRGGKEKLSIPLDKHGQLDTEMIIRVLRSNASERPLRRL